MIVYQISYIIFNFLKTSGLRKAWIFVVPTALFLIGLTQIFSNSRRLSTFGDVGYLSYLLNNDKDFSRWFLGTSLLKLIYLNFSSSLDSTQFVLLAGSITMFLGSIVILQKTNGKFTATLFLQCPIFILMSLKYDEYYPFVVPVAVFVILYLLDEYTPRWLWMMPIIAGLLPLWYIGLAPFSFFIVLKSLNRGAKSFFVTLIIAISTLFLTSNGLWVGGIKNFWDQLKLDSNLGELNTVWEPYRNKSILGTPFFQIDFAFSPHHIFELFQLLLRGGGIFALLGLLVFIFRTATSIPKIRLKEVDVSALTKSLFLIYQIMYLMFMIPKLGPQRDTDLFAFVYISFIIFFGMSLDGFFRKHKISNGYQKRILSLLVVVNTPLIYATIFN